jgi:hypothetical protein
MFTLTSSSSNIQVAKHYRAEQPTRASYAVRTRRLRIPRFAPPSVLTSRWWVASDAQRYGRSAGQGGTPRAAW